MKVVSLLTASVLSAGVMFGCAPATMVIPQDVLSLEADEIVATERKHYSGTFVSESFKLGAYEVKDVDRDWNSSDEFSIGEAFSKESTTSGYQWVLGTASGDISGSCSIEGSKKILVGFHTSALKIDCACEGSAGKASVLLDSIFDSELEGTLTTRSGSYNIKGIYESNRGLFSGNPSGYRVDGEQVVAAADVLHPGKVWLGKKLSDADKDDITCLFAGLMLYTGKEE